MKIKAIILTLAILIVGTAVSYFSNKNYIKKSQITNDQNNAELTIEKLSNSISPAASMAAVIKSNCSHRPYIREGNTSYGKICFIVDGKYIREGSYGYGKILYNIDGKYIREGNYSYGTIIYNIDGKYIREGQYVYGKILYNIDREYIREGNYSHGKILYNIDAN